MKKLFTAVLAVCPKKGGHCHDDGGPPPVPCRAAGLACMVVTAVT